MNRRFWRRRGEVVDWVAAVKRMNLRDEPSISLPINTLPNPRPRGQGAMGRET